MTCPRCLAEFEPGPAACPECGVQLLRNLSGMLKTSVVLISAAGEQCFYRSVQDVPEPLRQELLRATASENSGTIVIADRAGREQLTQVVARRAASELPVAPSGSDGPYAAESGKSSFLKGKSLAGFSWVVWAGIGLVLGAAGVIAAAFTIHW